MTEATFFLFKPIIHILSVAVLLTFLFRLLKVDYYNPIVQGMTRITDIFTSVIRSFIKPFFGFDLASLLIVILLQSLTFYLIFLAGYVKFDLVTMMSWALYSTLLLSLRMIWWSLLIGVLISWIASSNTHPAIKVIHQMSDKISGPFRLFLPPMGGIDFSPIFSLLLLQFLHMALRGLSLGSGLPINLSIGY